jgi:hypothetical protein
MRVARMAALARSTMRGAAIMAIPMQSLTAA